MVHAGANQTVDAGTVVVLMGTASDSDGTIVRYLWEQTGGAAVALSGSDTATAMLTAPDVPTDETLNFRLTVTDDDGASASDDLVVAVERATPEPPHPQSLSYKAFVYSNGAVFDAGLNRRKTRLTFGDLSGAVGPFTLESDDVSARGTASIGSCNLEVIASDFPKSQGPQAGTLIELDPCKLDRATEQLVLTNADTGIEATSEGAGQSVEVGTGRFILLSAGSRHTCGLRDISVVQCWGDDTHGQSSAPAGTFLSISARGSLTCGLRYTGAVECWGRNEFGQANPPAGSFTSVSSGYHHACGLRDTGDVECWGRNREGQSTAHAGTFFSVSTGAYHTCGLLVTGAVQCWGWDEYGQSSPPTGTFASVSAGGAYTCGLRESGAVDCWGSDQYGHLMPPSGPFVSLNAGGYHSCGLRDTGAVECWGRDYDGQSSSPVGMFSSVSAGDDHTCGILSDAGSMFCWGNDEHGQSMAPGGTRLNFPPAVSAGADQSVDSGEIVALSGTASDPDGTIASYLWEQTGGTPVSLAGANGAEAMFNAPDVSADVVLTFRLTVTDNDGVAASDDVDVTVGTDFAKFILVSAASRHTCGLRDTGAVECWGDDGYGQSTPPTGAFTSVSAGLEHTCGLRVTAALSNAGVINSGCVGTICRRYVYGDQCWRFLHMRDTRLGHIGVLGRRHLRGVHSAFGHVYLGQCREQTYLRPA